MSANRHLTPVVDTTMLKAHFAVVTDAVGAMRFPVKSNKFPPTVNLVIYFSYFLVSLCTLFFHMWLFKIFGLLFWELKYLFLSLSKFWYPGIIVPVYLQIIFSKFSCLRIWPYICIPGQLHIFDVSITCWNCAINAKLGIVFFSLLISSWNLAIPCPPLEVAQAAPLVVGQGLLGE